jgi:hypothetical protein
MPVTIAATLATLDPPTDVQVVVNGMTNGLTFQVTGAAGGSTWTVPGGIGVSDGTQLVLYDNRSAINVAITYSVLTGGATYSATPVTVPYSRNYILQGIDGLIQVPFTWQRNGLPRRTVPNVVAYNVAGRSRPPTRFAPGGDGGSTLSVRVSELLEPALEELVKAGAPVVLRSNGSIRDWPAVELFTITDAPSGLWIDNPSVSPERVYDLQVVFSDDPEPAVAATAFTWLDFDTVYSSFTWSTWDTEWSPSTWNSFDSYDWGQRL